MTETLTLPSLTTIPENIDEQLRYWLRQPRQPGQEEWLFELVKSSGHLSTPDALRWRVISMIWLAAEYDVDKAWPYLMWLNTGEPAISEHLIEILSEAANDLDCHVELANWLAQAKAPRLVTFFSDFHPVPARYTMPGLVKRLLLHPTAPEVGVWLAAYCRALAGNANTHLRPWRLLTAAWYATCFDPSAGLTYLRELSGGEPTLSAVDNKILTDMASELNAVTAVIQWLATCPDPAVKTILQNFGHPDLGTFAAAIFQQPPNYQHLADSVGHAEAEAHLFKQTLGLLEKAGISPKTAPILNLACGPLATYTLLFNSAGYKTSGVDLHIPPAYLPTASLTQRLFQRGKYVKAWESVTAAYYRALAQATGLKLNWSKVKIELADLTRLQFPDGSFEAVICLNHLQHAPDVESLLAEAARVLKPGGVFVADMIPFAALNGSFSADCRPPWAHLRQPDSPPSASFILNHWREGQYRAALEKFFTIELWQAEQDEQAVAQLTPAVRAELTAYNEAELTRRRVMVFGRVAR